MNVNWGDNYIDATNTFIGGDGTGGGGNTGNITINNNTSNNNLSDYIYTSNNTHLYLKNPNEYGDIRFANLYTIANTTRDHNVKIDYFGKLYVYHPYNLANPTVLEGWKDVESEISGLIFGLQANSLEVVVVQGQIAAINAELTFLQGKVTGLEPFVTAINANMEAMHYGFYSQSLYEEMVGNNFNILINQIPQLTTQFRDIAFNTRVTQFIGGLIIPAAAGSVIGYFATHLDNHNLYLAYSNALSSNQNLTPAERNQLLEPSSNIIRENYISFNSNFSNMTLEQGFINSNITSTQFIPLLKSNKVLLGNITTPNNDYQLEMTGNLNANEYYRNSTSLTSLLAQKQDNMSATQPIFITTANIGLNYDSSLTKVGNNLSVVKTASAPLRWSGNNLILDFDSTLLNNSGNLGVSIGAESKWAFTGANIYNKALTNVGIGTNSGLTHKFNVVGESYFSSNINIATSKFNFISSYTGATLTQVNGETEYYLQYTGNGTLILNDPCACDLLIVGAGGNGGVGASSGGGGAGEVIYYPNFPLRSGTLNITVGTSSSTVANRISRIYPSSGNEIINAKGGGDGGFPDYLFTANGSITLTINAKALYNYTEIVNLSAGNYSITFATGSITLTGIAADKSYPLLKNGSGVTINPTVWYKFDTSTNLGLDDMGIHNLTNPNGVAFSNDYIKGNGSASFDGTNDYLTKDGAFNLNNKSWSVSVWCKKTSNTRSDLLFELGTGYTAYTTLTCGYNLSNNIIFGVYSDDLSSSSTYNDAGIWVHVCFTFLTGTKRGTIYRNGVQVGQKNFSGELNTNNDFRIGKLTTNYFQGLMDDFRIYDIELTATQVSELYKGRVVIYANPTSGGSGGGGAKSQTGAVAGVKFDDYKSFALAGLNGTSTNGGNGGTGNTTYGTRFTTTITGTSLSVGLGGSGVGVSPGSPATKTNYGDGGDGNSGVGAGGIVIIKFKEASSHLQLKAIKDNANTGLILNANETTTPYQLRFYPWSDTYQLTGIATRGWSMRVHDGNNHLDLLNLFSSFGGRIGIKTKNPTAILDVNGDITCKTFNIIGNELYGITCQVVNQHDTGEASINISAGASGNYGNMAVVYLPTENLGYISCSKSLQIKTQSIGSYIHIDNSTGYVGIGNNLPQAKLHVSGTILASSVSVTTVNADSVAAGNISCTSLDLNNGSIIDCNRLNSVDVWTGPIKATSLDLDGGNITNGGFFYGMAQQARFLNMSTGEWHYDTQSRNRFYFTNDGTSSHTVFRTGSTTHYFQDKDGTDYCLLDRFGISTYFEVISGGGYDNLGVTDASVTGVYVYRKMLVRLSTFTEVHRCFIEDDLYLNYDDFINEYVGRIVVSKGKVKTALKEAGEDWRILEGKDGITIDDSHPVVELSRKKKDKAVVGVITKRNQNNDLPGRLVINSLGETGIWVVNSGGCIETGDLITTSLSLGYGELQTLDNGTPDDIIRNYTIGKSIINCNFDLNSNEYKCEDLGNGLLRAFLPIFIYSG